MGGRYVVTGVQLGMLIGIDSLDDRQKLVDAIVEEQHIGDSQRLLSEDLKELRDSVGAPVVVSCGGLDYKFTKAQYNHVKSLLAEPNRKITAIKFVRDNKICLGLKECKDLVESM